MTTRKRAAVIMEQEALLPLPFIQSTFSSHPIPLALTYKFPELCDATLVHGDDDHVIVVTLVITSKK